MVCIQSKTRPTNTRRRDAIQLRIGKQGTKGEPPIQAVIYAVAICRLAWKHSRQNTGRPWVGLNGTVVSLPHCEQLVRVSTRAVCGEEATGPYDNERLDLQFLQRRGSFLNCLSWKNNCSPAVKINSELQSTHFNTLS